MNGSTRYARVAACALAFIGSAFVALPALADTVEGDIATPLPTYQVLSNGSSYHQVQGGAGAVAFSVTADAEVAGQVTSVRYDVTAQAAGSAGGPYAFTPKFDVRTFSGKFHKKETLAGSYQPAEAELVAACNNLADGLRAQGRSDGEIFGQDRQLAMDVSVAPSATFSGPSGFMDPPQLLTETTSITCLKWGGAVGFAKPAPMKAVDGVSDAHLTLIEQYGPSGMCEIILSGVITTTSADMEVRFQYEHYDGKKSNVETVTTDHSKTAMFSHKYTVPNQDGPEGGSVRMVGVSPSFTSNAAAYAMNCSEGGPGAMQAALLPEVSLTATQTGQVMVGGQYCPTGLLLRGRIEGKGGAISGQAFFVGPGYASQHHPWQVGGNQAVVVEDVVPLAWTAAPAQAMATPNAVPQAKTQTVTAGFNLLGTNNTEIAHVPQRNFTVTCSMTPPSVVHGAGGFTPGQAPASAQRASPAMALPGSMPGAAPARKRSAPAAPTRTAPAGPVQRTPRTPATPPSATPEPETNSPPRGPGMEPVQRAPAPSSRPAARPEAPAPAVIRGDEGGGGRTVAPQRAVPEPADEEQR